MRVGPLLLGILAVLDATFGGLRAAMGRNPQLAKIDYYLRSCWLGAGVGLLSVTAIGGYVAATVFTATDPQAMYADYLRATTGLLWVYGTYATIVLLGIMAWTYPGATGRTLAVVLVLGPFTLVRPATIIAGAALGGARAATWQVRLGCVLLALVQLGAERWLNALQHRRQTQRFRDLRALSRRP